MSYQTSRRSFLGLCGAAALATFPLQSMAQAAATKLDVNDPTAKSLGFVENASTLTPAKEAAFKPGSHCASCQLYGAAEAKGGYAPCGAFGGKLVPQNGWCRAYTAKA